MSDRFYLFAVALITATDLMIGVSATVHPFTLIRGADIPIWLAPVCFFCGGLGCAYVYRLYRTLEPAHAT